MAASHLQPAAPRQRYLDQLSTSLFHFILPLLPTPEELNTKQQVRVLIEKLIRTVEPKSRLLAFGSTANGFSLRNSDMDLCVLLDPSSQPVPASELVTLIGNLLERETNFAVKSLPKAYVPIIKLSLLPSPGLPFGIACDIGFENRLALENTRLLLTYATVDPARVRTMVLFVKVWSKRRRINSPYRGTLSSYGYTLLVLFFLIHVQQPSVLPNLQAIPPPAAGPAEHEVNGWDVWFFDDTELLRREWSSGNVQSVGELLIDFFRFYCQSFAFNTDVVSIRAGLVTKESKNWTTDSDVGGMNEMSRERNRLCIEDPFERSYNVARTVTKDGLFTIRGEFMRATRILTTRPERAVAALAQLCEERDEELMHAPRSRSPRPGGGGGGGRAPYPGGGAGYRGSYSPPKNHYSMPTSSSSLHAQQQQGGVGGGAHHVGPGVGVQQQHGAGGARAGGGAGQAAAAATAATAAAAAAAAAVDPTTLHRNQSHAGTSRVPYPTPSPLLHAHASAPSPALLPHAPGIAPLIPSTRTPMFSPLGSPASSPRARAALLAAVDAGEPAGQLGQGSARTSPVLLASGAAGSGGFYTPLNGAAASVVGGGGGGGGGDAPVRGRQDAYGAAGTAAGGAPLGLEAYAGGYGEGGRGAPPGQAAAAPRGRTGGRVHDLRGSLGAAASPGGAAGAGVGGGALGQPISALSAAAAAAGGGGPGSNLSAAMGNAHLGPHGAAGGLPFSSSSTSSSRRAVSTPPPGSGFGVAPLYNERLYAAAAAAAAPGAGYEYGAEREAAGVAAAAAAGSSRPSPTSGLPSATPSGATSPQLASSVAGSGYTSPHAAHHLPPRPHLLSGSPSAHSLAAAPSAAASGSTPSPSAGVAQQQQQQPNNAGFAAALATASSDADPPSFLSPSLLLSPEPARPKPLAPLHTEPPLFALASGAHAGAVGDAPSVFPRYPHPPGTRTRDGSRSRERTRESSPLARDRAGAAGLARGSAMDDAGLEKAMRKMGLEAAAGRERAAVALATGAGAQPLPEADEGGGL